MKRYNWHIYPTHNTKIYIICYILQKRIWEEPKNRRIGKINTLKDIIKNYLHISCIFIFPKYIEKALYSKSLSFYL